jgi:hypothetical protein
MRIAGIILIVVGVVMTVFTGFNITTKKKIVNLGKVEINKEEHTPIYWSPVTGIVLLGIGLVVLVAGRKK